MLGYLKLITVFGVLIFFISYSNVVHCGLASTWAYCECSWNEWKPWSDCNSICYGMRVRTRSVHLTLYSGCDEFTDCASTDMGSEYEGCNEVCYNGGNYNGVGCDCEDGFYGSCCRDEVTCGAPSSLTNGYIEGTSYTYGSSITYKCNVNYNVTGGQDIRTCQLDSTWSGSKLRCGFVNSCASSPCMNAATCTNILDGYMCACTPGWSGITCTEDIQPPVAEFCSADINVTTGERIEPVTWASPEFTDPMGRAITIQTNYPQHKFDFPWGDFTVQYTAVKTSNGLNSECSFDIRVRPNPCPELAIPENGASVCNGWKTDYGQYCLVFCSGNYTLMRGVSFGDWYVCGASGVWSPSSAMSACISKTNSPSESPFRFSSCSNETAVTMVKKYYIEQLKSSDFNYFCDSYSDLCKDDNVSITC